MMSKWIDYDAIDYRNDKLHDKSEEFLNGVIYMAQRIEEAPSIDLTTCEECKHWQTYWTPIEGAEDLHYCPIVDGYHFGDWYCSDGERKESE